MDESGTWFFVKAGAVDVNLLCSNDTKNDGYNDEEKGYRPSCNCANGNLQDWTWNSTYFTNVGQEVDQFRLHSLHYDGGWGDRSRMYNFSFWVRSLWSTRSGPRR